MELTQDISEIIKKLDTLNQQISNAEEDHDLIKRDLQSIRTREIPYSTVALQKEIEALLNRVIKLEESFEAHKSSHHAHAT